MTTEPEQILEDNLIAQLIEMGYEYVTISNETELIKNLQRQLAKHNKKKLSDSEIKNIVNEMSGGSIFEKATKLRDRLTYLNDDGEKETIELINKEKWCQNEFQVTRQVTMEGKYENRYDVTILINGIPMVQIELKKKGVEMKEAFHQVVRYQAHSFGSGNGLFQYVQLFVISNGVNTKYFSNNAINKLNPKQTFYWSDKENNLITQLCDFTTVFLQPCQLSKIITRYIVLNQSERILMVLRPYQYYAAEAIIETVEKNAGNGFIWHTTGSGKTLTSFKASQVISNYPKVHKVVFVVDRKDLDTQTATEFNSFAEGSVDSTDNTRKLVKQFGDDTQLIVTTIQKLNTAIQKDRYSEVMEKVKDKRIIFIFDECHRSQFGDIHKRIVKYFNNYQMFGFTGTPIFKKNSPKKNGVYQTTDQLFHKELHKYVITDAIKDGNVLRFSIEYFNTLKVKSEIEDEDVIDIDEKEAIEDPRRLAKVVDYIIENHDRKTHNTENTRRENQTKFTGLMCVSSVDVLVKYYQFFKKAKEEGRHTLRIATIFSYQDNEDKNKITDSSELSREYLDSFIEDYNKEFKTKYSTKDSKLFYEYYNDVAKRVKNRQIDILLVVNMFLTGFDSKPLNTIYVDKNLKYHGLIQAYSRTNRILDETKSQGNVVCFRDLKEQTDQAIELFSTLDNKDEIIMQPYEFYVNKFNEAFRKLKSIAPTVDSVNEIIREDDQAEFIKAFRDVMREKNIVTSFADFSYEDVEMQEQEFTDYSTKYQDLHDSIKSTNESNKTSILDCIDFELELIHRDTINVAYILDLLAKMDDTPDNDTEAKKKNIIDKINSDPSLRSKRNLIEKFINERLSEVKHASETGEMFYKFAKEEKDKELQKIIKEEQLNPERFDIILSQYVFTGKEPMMTDVLEALNYVPKFREKKSTTTRIIDRMKKFIEIYFDGIDK